MVMNLYKTQLNKVLCQDKISKIKSSGLRRWATDFMTLKNILGRLLTVVLGTFVFCLIYFVLRQKGLEGAYGALVFNQGSAFGSGASWAPWTVYLIKSLVAILFFVSFFIFNKWYCYTSLWFVFINALCILIDKAMVVPIEYAKTASNMYDTVVDYFDFGSFVNNIGDIFIIIFACTSVVGITVYLVNSDWFKDDEPKDNTKKEVANV